MADIFTIIMATRKGECLFSPCNSKGKLQAFKDVAVQKIIATSKIKRDGYFSTLSGSQILAHKSCYCSYTSNSRNNVQKKRKCSWDNIGVSKRMLKSECSDFVFKRDCLLCGKECKPKDSKNPQRWVKVRKCTTLERDSNITFKQKLEQICGERQDQWANEVMVRLGGINYLLAANAQ